MLRSDTFAARMSTKGAIRAFLRYAKRLSQHTQRRYRDALYRFLGDMPEFVDEIKAEHIEIHLQKLRVSNNSKNTYLVAVRSFFHYLADYHDIPNVAEKIKNFRSEPVKQVVISENELEKILEVCKSKECSVIRFLAATGLRAQEFCDLNARSVSPDLKYITIIGKNKKRRTVPLNETARIAWPDIFYKKWNRDKLTWLCRKLADKAGIPRFGPHALRHYWETELIKRGIPISLVAKIAGHSVEVAIKIYSHICHDDILGLTDILDKSYKQNRPIV